MHPVRYKFLIIISSIVCHTCALANITQKDSLLGLLPKTKQSIEKFNIYRNLADLTFETANEKEYLLLAYQEALKIGETEQIIETLGNLSFAHCKNNKVDSAQYYLDILKETQKYEKANSWITYLNMNLFDQRMSREDNKDILDEKLKKKNSNSDIYSEIEYAYIVGTALFKSKKYDKSLSYFETAYTLASRLPLKERYKLQYCILRILSRNYTFSNNFIKAIALVEETLALTNKHYELFIKKQRPFYRINSFYIPCYTSLLNNSITAAPQKVNLYAEKIKSMLIKTQSVRDKYSCLLALYNYYLTKNDFIKALALNDSLIKYAHEIAPENAPDLYRISSVIYEYTGRHKEALSALKTSYMMQDSFNTFKSQEQLNQLQVKYDVDKLNYENSQLEIRNKQILLIALSSVLLISIFVCIYLLKSLKKEKIMKIRLRLLKNKAEESEKMKTAFINSICHEIRTPLNAIVGFSDLAFDDSIDEKIRESFPAEIQKNTNLLTSLINSMLEVSDLDVSDEKLPCEPINLNVICFREIDRLKEQGKAELEYLLDIPQEAIIINSNERYLSLMLDNLLNNANKFTETGFIHLHFHINSALNKVIISITDTGCGIPEEKREEVFERFTKLDLYRQGNGLGLYLCRLIIRRLSGEIVIDPEYTTGTRFTITLPIN